MAFTVAVDDNGKTVLPVISASANLLQITIVVDVNAKPCNSGPERLPLRVGERIPILENFPDAVFRQSQFLGGCLAVEKRFSGSYGTALLQKIKDMAGVGIGISAVTQDVDYKRSVTLEGSIEMMEVIRLCFRSFR